MLLRILILCLISSFCFGQNQTDGKGDTDQTEETESVVKAESTSSSIAGDFGMGIGIGVNSASEDHINNAVIVDGRVNVTDSESVRTQLWLRARGSLFIRRQIYKMDMSRWL